MFFDNFCIAIKNGVKLVDVLTMISLDWWLLEEFNFLSCIRLANSAAKTLKCVDYMCNR